MSIESFSPELRQEVNSIFNIRLSKDPHVVPFSNKPKLAIILILFRCSSTWDGKTWVKLPWFAKLWRRWTSRSIWFKKSEKWNHHYHNFQLIANDHQMSGRRGPTAVEELQGEVDQWQLCQFPADKEVAFSDIHLSNCWDVQMQSIYFSNIRLWDPVVKPVPKR